jgi:hypothetical protein
MDSFRTASTIRVSGTYRLAPNRDANRGAKSNLAKIDKFFEFRAKKMSTRPKKPSRRAVKAVTFRVEQIVDFFLALPFLAGYEAWRLGNGFARRGDRRE